MYTLTSKTRSLYVCMYVCIGEVLAVRGGNVCVCVCVCVPSSYGAEKRSLKPLNKVTKKESKEKDVIQVIVFVNIFFFFHF